MNILINCAGLKKGGGLQVADSVCRFLGDFPQHQFVVVLSSNMEKTVHAVEEFSNTEVLCYSTFATIKAFFSERDNVLDTIVLKKRIDVVLSLFGPVLWTPKSIHICGFARSHLLLTDSPYFTRMSFWERFKNYLQNIALKHVFNRSSKVYFTENSYISEKLRLMFPSKKIYTITNYYNQVFDLPEQQIEHPLPTFDGITLLSVNAPYSHKNMPIAIDIARILKLQYPDFKFRFVLTVKEDQYPEIETSLKENFLLIGEVNINECPSLYYQSDICFQPTLLECFTATYVEAMRTERPIITTDLNFARGLCKNAAIYYEPLSAQKAADAIYEVSTNTSLRNKLITSGKNRLRDFDNYRDRARKLIELVEFEYKNNQNNVKK